MSPTMRKHTIILTPEPDGSAWNVTVPALPGCFTYGETADEAIENAHDAIAGHIEALQMTGQPVPGETEHPRLASVAVA